MAFAAGLPTATKRDILAGVHMEPMTFTGNTTSGSPTVASLSSTTGFYVGQLISGAGIPAACTIIAITTTTLTLSANATATATGVTLTSSDNYFCALYTQAGATTMNASATVYSTTGEVSGTGYTAGGFAVTRNASGTSSTSGIADFVDPSIPSVTLTGVDAYVIYNKSQGNKIFYIGLLAAALSPTAGTLTIIMPPSGGGAPDSTNALIRIT